MHTFSHSQSDTPQFDLVRSHRQYMGEVQTHTVFLAQFKNKKRPQARGN